MLYRALSLENLHHWSVERSGELKGGVELETFQWFTDSLWLAVPDRDR